jgi:hypothetical protein
MKYGTFNMIPKANNEVCNGNSQHLHKRDEDFRILKTSKKM